MSSLRIDILKLYDKLVIKNVIFTYCHMSFYWRATVILVYWYVYFSHYQENIINFILVHYFILLAYSCSLYRSAQLNYDQAAPTHPSNPSRESCIYIYMYIYIYIMKLLRNAPQAYVNIEMDTWCVICMSMSFIRYFYVLTMERHTCSDLAQIM